MRSLILIAIAIVVISRAVAPAQTADVSTVPVELASEPTEEAWAFSLSVYSYIVPDDDDYAQPTVTADRDWLHLEARYNYEDLNTLSVWVGYNVSVGDQITLDFTVMAGGVFGDTHGVAPGYEFTLAWRQIELYSEAEYVIDTDDTSESFFYTWSELTYSPVEWFRAGLVVQRTKVYDTNFDIDRGLMVGVTCKRLDFAVYVLNPDNRPTVVLGVSYGF